MCFRHFRLDDLVQSGIGGFPVSLRLGGIMLCDFYLSTEAMEFAERGDSRNAWIPADHHRSLILPSANSAARLATFEGSLVRLIRRIQRMAERDSRFVSHRPVHASAYTLDHASR